jgi:broad specificity phosphatase PhoE
MPRLYLIRHALPKPRGRDDLDPPLDPKGRRQAEAMAEGFEATTPLPIHTSPLMRCRATAAALAARWESVPRILEPLREVPGPEGGPAVRAAFLKALLQESWPSARARDPVLRDWYDALIEAVSSVEEDSILVSHYVAINALVGRATGADQVQVFSPGHTSVTILEAEGGGFSLLRLGVEAKTQLTSG